MVPHPQTHSRILAIDPCTKGFGFAVLEGGNRLIDWGVARLYSKNDEEFLVRVDALINRYKPTAIAVEDVAGTRKGERTAKRVNDLVGYATLLDIERALVSGREAREALGLPYDATKYEVARTIAELFPELKATLPPPRKPWQTEDERMNVFDAVGLAIATSARQPGLPRSRP
jgi:Holliday junction resolvasome RuvABC endonuclease subunit